MKFRQFFLSLCVAGFATSFADCHADNPFTTRTDGDNRVVYSIYLRNYTNPEAAGTFNDLRNDLPRLKDLGIDVIHLLPFYEMGVEHAKGSPYCIRNYRRIDPRYGTINDLKALVKDIHANGMEIWFDWVGNHTAYDHPWVKKHPEWYTKRQDFDDVRSVDASNPELRKAMAEEMKYWVKEAGIDGYRCDFAHAPGLEFWSEIIDMVDPEHKLYWLAEGNEDGIRADWIRAKGGPFDSRYGWTYSEYLYKDANDRRHQTDKSDADKALFHLAYPQDVATALTYIGSHDIFQGMDNSVSPNTQDAIYGDNLVPFTVMTMTAPGLPMVYMGQEINYKKEGGVGIMTDNEAIDWHNVDKDYLALVKRLIRLRHENPAMQTINGKLVNHSTDNDSVYVFERRNGDESVVVMLNFSYNPQTFRITSNLFPCNTYNEIFTQTPADIRDNESFTVPGKGYAVYEKLPGELHAQMYSIILEHPTDEFTEELPTVSIYTEDPLHTGGRLQIVDNEEMYILEGYDGGYRYDIPYLPDFGYTIEFGYDGGKRSVPFKESRAGSRTYILRDGGSVVAR